MAYAASFRPLSWGLSFNKPSMRRLVENGIRFRPLSWGLSFNFMGNIERAIKVASFRPLSWGLSFNKREMRLLPW